MYNRINDFCGKGGGIFGAGWNFYCPCSHFASEVFGATTGEWLSDSALGTLNFSTASNV